MDILRVGVMGCSDFAARAMMPAMQSIPHLRLTAVASRSADKARDFAKRFGIDGVEGYGNLLDRGDVDVIYMPLPTGLHQEWIPRAIAAGKHILVEKSFTHDYATAQRLIAEARAKRRLIIENFLFPHHAQSRAIRERLCESGFGTVVLFRSTFTIPPLKSDNFRYSAELGGGALLDLGAYMVRAVRHFFGNNIRLVGSTLRVDKELGIDTFGTATFITEGGMPAQVTFGLNASYQCTWEFLGTGGKLISERAYTPPPGYRPVLRIERQDHREEIVLPSDNHYVNKLNHFVESVMNPSCYEDCYSELEAQSRFLDHIKREAVVV